ncbi:fibrocystin-L-like [Etheostoma cragini]|uniref:fibrocystin-L-like n=1 Tax=Etheostoma cragini TaxID=417921 RepID=UPI00155F18CF|nr:fibrocystin-L-like [Etheostoma cragini]
MESLIKPAALLLALWCCCCSAQQRVDYVSPHLGSSNGATRLTITGNGFAQEKQFQLNPKDDTFGNRVTLVSDTLSVPCDVERDSTHGNQIMCYTRAMPAGQYMVRVSVDGVSIPDSNLCRAWYYYYYYYYCSFYPDWSYTPTISSLSPVSGPPGTLVTLRGRIITDVYGSNTATSSNGLNVRFVRAYMGGMPCELLKPESDELYGLRLDYKYSQWGTMSCKMTGTYVGHHNLSYILDGEYGRSFSEKNLYRVSALGKLSMFQTFAEVTGVSPSMGSVLGGTLLTIYGRFFDQTDRPARVLVGGLPCEIQSVSDDRITCRTAKQELNNNATVYPGGRGLKMEVWNNTISSYLTDIWRYNWNTTGYWTQWIDSMPYVLALENNYLRSRSRGFLVPPSSANYTIYLQCYYQCELYLSNSSRPEEMVRVAYQGGFATLALEEGKPYYIEILHQGYGSAASVNLAIFQGDSSFTEDKADGAVNEVQDIEVKYDVFDEEQVVTFESWPRNVSSVKEVQRVTVSSSCESYLCESTFFSLGYGDAMTGPIPVSATAAIVEASLNSLWSIKPDKVQVTKEVVSQESHYNVTFDSDRGDFKPLQWEVFGFDTNITVAEVTKGRSNMKTFTLFWGGIPTKPIAFDASESEVLSALKDMMKPECPAEILTTEGTNVKYFKDFENDHYQFNSAEKGTPVKDAFCGLWSLKNAEVLFKDSYTKESGGSYGPVALDKFPTLCFAYKGMLNDEVGMKFTYLDSQGKNQTNATKISTLFTKGQGWSYKCMDLQSSLQTEFIGSSYSLQEFYLYKDNSGADFYVDAVYIGKTPTTDDETVVPLKRRPPLFESSGRSFEMIAVSKTSSSASQISYTIKAKPLECAFDFPISYTIKAKPLECAFDFPLIGVLQMSNSSEDMLMYSEGAATINITRPHRATPPLNGTFDVEIYGGRAKGLPVDISEKDLKYALEGIAGMGQVSVTWQGNCRRPKWRVKWLTKPGDQPLIQFNSSSVVGKNAVVLAFEIEKGGLLRRSMTGDFFRVWETKPQVEVFINGIPSKCSGDCGFGTSGPKIITVSVGNMSQTATSSFTYDTDVTAQISGLSPRTTTVIGHEVLTIQGSNLGGQDNDSIVFVGGEECVTVLWTATSITCLLPVLPPGMYMVDVRVGNSGYPQTSNGVNATIEYILEVYSISPLFGSLVEVFINGIPSKCSGDCGFQWSEDKTPVVTGISPSQGSNGLGTLLTITGTGFGSENASIIVGKTRCHVEQITATTQVCRLGSAGAGSYPVFISFPSLGDSRSTGGNIFHFTYQLIVSSFSPVSGSIAGGTLLTVEGFGFSQNSTVIVGSDECTVVHASDTELKCRTPATPVITDVSPRRGGTAGGTRVTITGSGFSTEMMDVNVTISGSVCDVQSTNNTHIVCVTNAQHQSQETKVRISIGDRGIAKMDNADFFYIDVWSSRFTWGGLSPPEKGSFAVITKGQTILLDTSTPVLKMLLIQGGTLVFDEADIELQAENILITDGGRLQIGQEGAPFQHKAIITLHGHLRSPELPVYGAKTLAVREGVLDLHGIPVPVPWTHLAQTATNGSATLNLMKAVTWKAGDEIVIASTGHRHSQRENEVRRIAAVSADGKNVTLTEPLKYTHLGVAVTLPDGTVFEGRAEVGVLTRNIVVRGSQNHEWDDKIEACPDGFDTGEFATQTCFQGRFGEEVGSDQFGGCIMFHAPRPNENLAIGRLEYVEVFHAGQAFMLGRYPIHWHLMGNVNYESYVRGCAIHQTFNRAVSIHNTHRLLVEHNVIYDIMGGAFFIEDGIETQNILQYNLAVFVKQSTSLLNDDITPAAYWVTNPNNIIRHNAAAGGTHFGFWYRMHEHPDGPSFDQNICQKRVPLGEFYNNTVHSQGWFGLWIFADFFPMRNGGCYSQTPEPAVFHSLTTWNCEKGAEWVNVGAVQFNSFLMVNNEKSGIEAKHIMQWAVSNFGEEGGATISNSTIVAYVDELGLGNDYSTQRGVIAPLDDGLSVLNTKFINFNRSSSAAIGLADGTCEYQCGGWAIRFRGIQYFNSPNKASFRWEHEVQLVDTDGSLTGNINNSVVPSSPLLDPAHCSVSAEWSVGFPGTVCDHTVNFHRLAISYSSQGSLVMLTNSHGTTEIGQIALLPSKQIYNWNFRSVAQINYIYYDVVFYGFKSDQYVLINHNFTQSPDRFHIIDWREGSLKPLSFSNNTNGDWYFNKTSNTLFYIVSGKTNQQMRHGSVDRSLMDIAVYFRVYYCSYPNCIEPTPATSPTYTLPTHLPFTFNQTYRPRPKRLWSDASFWNSSAENNFAVPIEGADVVIPAVEWVVLDVNTPPLNKLTIFGVLEIPDYMNSSSSRPSQAAPEYRSVVVDAVYISIQGGRLIAGWADEPFRGQLHIKLRGNHRTPEWPLPNGPNQGSKVLGVFGTLELYGQPHNVYHTKLAATANAGSTTLTLSQSVDWQVGDEVVISTTSYNAWETEKRQITAVSADGRNLTLNQPLTNTHIGETHAVSGTSFSYTLAADVGLVTRNIKIIGQEYPNMMTESFGARLLVGTYSWAGINYKGKAQIRNVEFFRSGQEGWTDYTDPRYSVAFLNLGEVSGNDSYIQGCAFHDGFAPAIGVFGTDKLNVDDNVVYRTVGEGFRIWGNKIKLRRNLVMMTEYREQPYNYKWNAAIEVNEGINVVLQHNIVAGYERVAYRIDGEPCPGYLNNNEKWIHNEAHGGLFGVYLNKDGLPGCSLIQGFFVWRSFDYGIYFQTIMDVIVSNVTLVDNGMGIMPLIFAPPSLSHAYADKTAHIQNTLIVGSSPSFNCSATLSSSDLNLVTSSGHRAPRPLKGGRSGICWPTFGSTHNNAPITPHHVNNNYNAIKGLMKVTDTTFIRFRDVCSSETNFMFITNPINEDLQHPVHVSGITMIDSTEQARVFVHRADVSKANPSDCVDMDCDAKKKTLLWISVEQHEAKFLRASTGEEDLEGATGGHDAVEERHSLSAEKTQQQDKLTVDQIQKAVSEHSNGGQTSGLCVRVQTLNRQHRVVQPKTLVALPGTHIGFNVSSMGIIRPPPPSSDPSWNQEATAEVTREEPTVSYVSRVNNLLLIKEPIAGEFVGPLYQQPSLMAVDQQGNCVSVGVTTLTVTASLKNSSGNSVDGLEGNTTIVFSTCWANFTDLSIQNAGEDLTMVFTLMEWGTQSRAFSVRNTSNTLSPTTDAPSTLSTNQQPATSNTSTTQSPSSMSTNMQSTTSNTSATLTPTTLSTNMQSTTSNTSATLTPTTLSTNIQSTTSNTSSNLTPTTQAPSSLSTNQQSTTSMSTLSSSSTVSASSLCLVSVIYAVACCLAGTPIC